MFSGNAYSSAQLRIRDKAIEEKHQREIYVLERKIQRLREAYDERSNALFLSENQGDKLARSFGFGFLGEAQAYIDVTNERTSYVDFVERIDALKRELLILKQDNQILRDEVLELMEERDLLKATVSKNQSAPALAKELVELQMCHDAAVHKARRAQEEFKIHYDKWRKYGQALKEKQAELKRQSKGISAGEHKRRLNTLSLQMWRKLKDMGLDPEVDPEELTPRNALSDHQHTPLQETRKRRLSNPPTFSSSSPTIVMSENVTPLSSGSAKSSSPLVVSSTRTPLEFKAIHIAKPSNFKPVQSSSPIWLTAPNRQNHIVVLDSSDTEDDSQGFDVSTSPSSKHSPQGDVPLIPDHRPTPASRTAQNHRLPPPHPTLPPRPSFPQFGAQQKQRHSDAFPTATIIRHPRPDGDSDDQDRPRKIRRFSSPTRSPLAVIVPMAVQSSVWHDNSEQRKDTIETSTARGRENRKVPLGLKRNAKDSENTPTSTPANASTSKQLTDYSAFKGRGRYGKGPSSANETINATYAIDPAQNGGLDFQYDEVVRGKEDRRRMEGGDCECCRGYYEAIGPLPNRLQPPLWRSPPNSPEKGKPCRHNAETSKQDAIASHKQAISRHRHHWVRASTPPSYWNIGFPTTQEANEINEKAQAMHEQKKKDVRAEAEKGGRYKAR
ncbi:DNA repair protein endonuclease SAE2/CtIP C-terminus-domain-containing protein [Mycena sp. CBHHK59/15]|nr:DNA repair protein endonuclease SAE2/CtIP C-terminus-domain-containing protein [Mycena sp. CBHHK59/15]